jgi:primosomal protein N' (replication factor Y)
MTALARVAFPLPLSQSFLYRVPEVLRDQALPGKRVKAPLGKKISLGFLVAVEPGPPPREYVLKDILEVLDDRPIWGASFLEFTRDLSAEFFSSWGEILQASLPPSLSPKIRIRVLPTAAGEETLEKKALGRRERDVMRLLAGTGGRAPLFLQRRTGIRDIRGLLARMAKKGLLTIRESEVPVPVPRKKQAPDGLVQLELGFGDLAREHPVLGPVLEKIGGSEARSFYLYGSDDRRGEAYEILVRRALDCGGRALVLVPEISMTGGIVSRLSRHLGREVTVFHGGLTGRRKETSRRAIRSGRASVAVGTRSALFLDPDPFFLVVVDGEHEESFLQTANPSYDARRGAWLRSRRQRGVVVFGSDRPTVEAFHEANRTGILLRLGPETPPRRVVWAAHNATGPLVSKVLRDRIAETLERKERAVLFLNRRGYAPSLACPACGHIPRCRTCDIPLVYHKKGERLVCRYCNASVSSESPCPECGARYAPRKGGGTQALEEELGTLFPSVSMARFDADTAPRPKDRERILKSFSKGKTLLLVGTQLLAYETRLPDVRLLAVLSPESLLGSADFRASQKTFQMVSQMMILAGPRTDVVVQTFSPPHFSVRAAAEGDYGVFYDQEIAFRRLMNYPPFSVLAEITLMGTELRALAANARKLRDSLQKAAPEFEVLGPAFAAAVRIKNIFRLQIILKAPERTSLLRALGETLPLVRAKKTVTVSYAPFDGA